MATTKRAAARKQAEIPGMAPWLLNMNEEQQAAILHQGGPARLIAVAGSGKTRVVAHRIMRLIQEGVDPVRILALTFSKKAADEMASRARKLGAEKARVGTWHSVCLEILRRDHHPSAEWDKGEAPRSYLKGVLGFRGIDWKGADANAVADFIGKCKACLEKPDSDAAAVRAVRAFGPSHERALEAFSRFNDELETNEFMSFDDYLVKVVDHLEGDEEALERWRARWDHVIQDEAQDQNPAQKRLIRLLAGGHGNYLAVGDPMQAIFGFRESHPDDLVRFEEEWPAARTYGLPRNYRSGRAIIAAANGVLESARVADYKPTPLVAGRDAEGVVRVEAHEDLDDEARSFGEHVARTVGAGDATYQSHCALFRTNAQSRALEEALLSRQIPYVVVGGVSFYERREVKQLLAYLRVAEGRGTLDDVELCINAPFRFLGKAFVEKLKEDAEQVMEEAETSAVRWGEIVRGVCRRAGIQFRQEQSAEEWATIVAGVSKAIATAIPGDGEVPIDHPTRPSVILADLVKRTAFIEWMSKEEGKDTLEISPGANVRELVRVAARFDSVESLLDYVETTVREARNQREDRQAGGNRVLLMNVHRSKGLEFERVWISGFNENIFPHPMGDSEEERRLAYVAMTRAKDELVLSHVRTMAMKAGIRDALPSRFIAEAMRGLLKARGELATDAPEPVAGDGADELVSCPE